MPEEEYVWLPREDILHFEEIERLVDVFVGARRRPRAADRRRAAAAPRPAGAGRDAAPRSRDLRDLALTTNGVLLADHARALRRRRPAPHHVSLDTLDRRSLSAAHPLRRARRACRTASLPPLARLRPASRSTRSSSAASTTTKLIALIEYGRQRRRRGAVHRVHGRRRRDALVARPRRVAREMLDALAQRATARSTDRRETSSAPADRYRAARRHDVRHHLVDDASRSAGGATAAG